MSESFRSSANLPEPAADARAHSQRLKDLILKKIDAGGGWIDFADYMNLCLYAPGLGYYSAGARKFGPDGDFVTAPEISPLFSACVARAIARQKIDGAAPKVVLELGAGTGIMAADTLLALDRLDALPDTYQILEVSADLKQRQIDLLTKHVPQFIDRIEWLQTLPPEPVDGVIIANEVLDALPVSKLIAQNGQLHAQVVAKSNGELRWISQPPAAGQALIREHHGADWPSPYVTEHCPSLPAFIGSLAQALGRGTILLLDYGAPASTYYQPNRFAGTLQCHYRHRVHDDPFFYPGLQDITAWVDFTAVAKAARRSGLDVLGYTTQASFLLAAGIDEDFKRVEAAARQSASDIAALQVSTQMQTLLLPSQMGEQVKVMTLARAAETTPADFGEQDLRHLL